MNAKLKPISTLRSDQEAEDFVAHADLAEYDLSQFKPMRFELELKSASLNMRLPAALLDAVKARARTRAFRIPATCACCLKPMSCAANRQAANSKALCRRPKSAFPASPGPPGSGRVFRSLKADLCLWN